MTQEELASAVPAWIPHETMVYVSLKTNVVNVEFYALLVLLEPDAITISIRFNEEVKLTREELVSVEVIPPHRMVHDMNKCKEHVAMLWMNRPKKLRGET
jgi:hypothetical protein